MASDPQEFEVPLSVVGTMTSTSFRSAPLEVEPSVAWEVVVLNLKRLRVIVGNVCALTGRPTISSLDALRSSFWRLASKAGQRRCRNSVLRNFTFVQSLRVTLINKPVWLILNFQFRLRC